MEFRGEKFRFSSPAEAASHLRAIVSPVESETIALADARGRVHAQDAFADRPSPAFDQSSMDGFAARFADVAFSALRIAGEVRIGGAPPDRLAPGTTLRIVTGGAIPDGADTVLRHEDIIEQPESIRVSDGARARIKPGDFIRRLGENAKQGDLLVPRGTILSPSRIGTLASAGIARPRVHRGLRVAIISTGDELVDAGESPTPWQLRDGNGPALRALLRSAPWIGSIGVARVKDSPPTISAAVQQALEGTGDGACDAVLLSGGVSMGHRDFVRPVLESLGARIEFHGLPQRPGKPMLVAIVSGIRHIFALPGNPLSSLICCRRIVLPVLGQMAGWTDGAAWAAPRVRLSNPDDRTIPLWWHRLVRLTEAGEAELVETRSSGDTAAAAQADGFVEVPPGESGVGPWAYFAF